jgi:hypothetical protein
MREIGISETKKMTVQNAVRRAGAFVSLELWIHYGLKPGEVGEAP